MLRHRGGNLKILKTLDAFPKVPDDYKKHSAVGGTFSLVSVCLIVWLIIAETSYFLDSDLEFKFEPDADYDSKIQLNVDLTVAMPCSRIGADVVDSTNENLNTDESLEEEDTWWELTKEQRDHFDAFKHMNTYFREEYHAIHNLLWKSNQFFFQQNMPKRTWFPNLRPNACRLHGSLTVNKVAGNFHITAGKSLTLPRGHVHISAFMSDREYNFTHRINKFSFGTIGPGIIHPLEGDEKSTEENTMLYQYFIEVVPTEIDTLTRKLKTYQYSVKDHERPIDHNKGSHGMPGIFFKYDTSALKVRILQQRDSFFQFLVRLCALVGGIFVTNNLINQIVQNFWYIICCRFLSESRSQDSIKGNEGLLLNKDVIAANLISND